MQALRSIFQKKVLKRRCTQIDQDFKTMSKETRKMTQTNQNNEPAIIENDSDYEAISLAWDIEEQTGDVPNGALMVGTMPKLYAGDLSNRMPILTESDLEEIAEAPSNTIGAVQKEINDYNAANQGSYDVADKVSKRPYMDIHDASELEKMAKEKELREMDKDGLYIKLSVAGYDPQGLPKLKATRWDGEILPEQDLLDNIAHYVADMKINGNKIPFDVGEAIMCIDKPVLEQVYGSKGASQMVTDVLVLMTPDYNRKVA